MTARPEPGTLTWDYDIPLVNNLYMLKDLLIVIVASLVGMQVVLLIVGFFAGGGAVILPLKIYAIVGGVLAVLFVIAAAVVFGNRHRTRFTVSSQGVAYESGSRERRINRVVLVLSVLAGRPGPSLIAVSRESGRFAWTAVEKVTVHPRRRVITLSDSWHPLLRLYCPAETFGEIVTLVEAHVAAAAAKRAGRPRALPRRSWTYAAWTAGVAVAAFLGMFYYDTQFDDAWRWLIGAAFLILIAGLVEAPVGRRLPALGGVVLGIYVLVLLLVEAARPITGPSGLFYGRRYEVDTPLLVLSVIGQLALIGMGGWRLFGRRRRDGSSGTAIPPPPG
jgi:hypothetical protein